MIAGWLISQYTTAPTIAVLIDRSYCPTVQWQHLIHRYRDLYQQHQHKSLEIKTVILFSDLTEEVRFNSQSRQSQSLPHPEELQTLQTYGSFSPNRRMQLQKMYPHSRLLRCD
jgi:hypothetical protein